MHFELDLPSWMLEDDNIAQQYIALWPSSEGPDYGFESAICQTVVGS